MNRDRPTVLLINDCQDILGLVGHYLRDLKGCRVLTATDGRLGLELMTRCQVDVVFLNIMMPVANGYDVLRAIEKSDALRLIPVVMWTAKERPKSMREFNTFGIAYLEWLEIPHDMPALMKALRRALGKQWEWWEPAAPPSRYVSTAAAILSRRIPVFSANATSYPPPIILRGPLRPPLLRRWGKSRWGSLIGPKVALFLLMLACLFSMHSSMRANLGPGYFAEVLGLWERQR